MYNKKMPSLAIVIINWNAGQQLVDCVESVMRYGSGIVKKIVVVDNGSSDGSEKAIEIYPEVDLICADENLGFGKACNLGASHCNSDFILFLNPDALLFEQTLEKSLSFMTDDSNKHVGISGVQLVDNKGHVSRSCARFPTARMFIAAALGLSKLLPNLLKSYHMHDWDHKSSRGVDHVIGAFFLVRQDLFQKLSGFDERFFVYLEDLDFSLRAKKAGWSSYYLTDTQAFHAGGGTSDQIKARRLFYSIRSRIIYSFKHFDFLSAVAVLLASMLIEPFTRAFFAILKGSWETLKEIIQAYVMLFQWLPRWLLKGETR